MYFDPTGHIVFPIIFMPDAISDDSPKYVDLSGDKKEELVQLREVVNVCSEGWNGKISWDSKTGTASVTLNGVTANLTIDDHTVENGHIMVDPDKFLNTFKLKGQVVAWRDGERTCVDSVIKNDPYGEFVVDTIISGGTGAIAKTISKNVAKKAATKTANEAVEGVRKSSRTFKELIDDIDKNPGDWKKTGETIIESTKKGNKGGQSIEEVYTNTKTGEKIYKHTLTNSKGTPIEAPHFRPYPKQVKEG